MLERRIRNVKLGKFVRIRDGGVADFIYAGEMVTQWQHQAGPLSRMGAATVATIWSAMAATATVSPAVMSGRLAG